MKRLLGVFVFVSLLLLATLGWFFTLLVDWPMLLALGYLISFVIFRFLTGYWRWLSTLAVLLLPISVLGLYAGGIPPYFNLIPPEQVYFHLIPKEFLGLTGNDFMWNGFLLPTVGRIVPLSIQPTYQYLGFNLFAVFIWLGMWPVLGWASAQGYIDAIMPVPWHKVLFRGLLKMLFLAVISQILLSAITLWLVWLYS